MAEKTIVKNSYENESDVPTIFKNSYSEQDGKFVLTGNLEVYTEENAQKILDSKKHVDTELSVVKQELQAEKQAKTEVQNKLEVVELQLKDGADPAKLQELVETKVKVATEELTKQLADSNATIGDLNGKVHATDKDNQIKANLDVFGDASKGDAEFYFGQIMERQEDGSYMTNGLGGLDKGLSFEQAKLKITEIKTHWLPQNSAGNATGATGGQGATKQSQTYWMLKALQTQLY